MIKLFLVISLITFPTLATELTNPDISVNALMFYQQGNIGNSPNAEETNGFHLQEAEIRLTSNIDTYFRGDVILAIEKENGEFSLHPEEVFAESLALTDVIFRMGKFYPYFGRSNQWHTHNFPFIDANMTRSYIFGEEGFNETGIAVSYLVPTPWYFELVAQAFNGENESVFASPSQDDAIGVYSIKNLWDLSDETTLEWVVSYAHGKNLNNEQNHIYNTAITFKATSAKTFIFTSEYTQGEKLLDENAANQGRTEVNSHWLQYKFSTRWWAQARGEKLLNNTTATTQKITKNSVLLAYVPSEFSALRFQYSNIENNQLTENEQVFLLQLNLTMGTHPAHNY